MFRLMMILAAVALMALAAAGCSYEEHDYCDPHEPVGRQWDQHPTDCHDAQCDHHHHRPHRHRHYGNRYDRW